MKVCIVGAGAIGGFFGTRLAAAGRAQVSAVARGATLGALAKHGWRMNTTDGLIQAPVAQVSDDPAALGPQDLVVIAVKGPALPAVARSMGPLLGPQTVVLPAMNGVPWWFCEGLPGFEHPLQSVDPGGSIAASIPFEQIVGCVVHASTFSLAPGLVQHKMGQGLIVGEPRGGHSDRAERIADLLAHAGFDLTHSKNVRYDVWYKLWGNLTMNPVSAITGATIDRILGDSMVRSFCSRAMQEASAVGARIGCAIEQSPEDRHAVTAKLGAFKTSMLQDVEAGREIELDGIVTAVQEIAQRLGEPTPSIDALLGLTRLFGQTHGLYPRAAT